MALALPCEIGKRRRHSSSIGRSLESWGREAPRRCRLDEHSDQTRWPAKSRPARSLAEGRLTRVHGRIFELLDRAPAGSGRSPEPGRHPGPTASTVDRMVPWIAVASATRRRRPHRLTRRSPPMQRLEIAAAGTFESTALGRFVCVSCIKDGAQLDRRQRDRP